MTAASRPTQQRGRRRREALLRSTIAVLAERGAKGVTHRAVADHAGLPQASTTYYFESRDQMLEEAMRMHVAERIQELNDLTERVRATGAADAEFVDSLIASLVDRPTEALASQFEFYLEAIRSPVARESVSRALAAFEQLAAASLEALGVNEPEQAAEGLVAVIDGFALHRVARARDRESDATRLYAALRAQLVASLMDDDELTRRFSEILAPPAG